MTNFSLTKAPKLLHEDELTVDARVETYGVDLNCPERVRTRCCDLQDRTVLHVPPDLSKRQAHSSRAFVLPSIAALISKSGTARTPCKGECEIEIATPKVQH